MSLAQTSSEQSFRPEPASAHAGHHPRRREARTGSASRCHVHGALRTRSRCRKRAQAASVAATCRGAIRTRPRQREAHNGADGRRHMPRSRSDSPATAGGAHRRCRSPPHATELFRLARDDGRRALAVPVAATCRGAIRTRPRQRETRTGAAGRRHMPRSRSDSPATTGGVHRQCQSPQHAVETRPRQQEARTGAAGRRHMSRCRSDSPATTGGTHRRGQSPPYAAEPPATTGGAHRQCQSLPNFVGAEGDEVTEEEVGWLPA